MKKIISVLIITLIFILASCSLGSFSPEIGSESNVATQYETDVNEYNESSGSTVSISVTSGALTLAADQEVKITVTNGIVDTNVDGTAIPGLTLYNLNATEADDGAYGRGNALAYTLSMYTIDDNTYVTLGLDMDTGTYSALFELYIDATTFTVNDGQKMLDLDGNDIPGQTSDDYLSYITVTGGAAITTGASRSPRSTLTSFDGMGPFTAGTTTILDAAVYDTNGEEHLTAAGIAASVVLEKWSAGVWTAVALGSPVYNNAATPQQFEATIPSLVVGDIYRFTYDPYLLTESVAVRGYVHRGSYDPYATVTQAIAVVDGTGEVRNWTGASMTNYTNGPSILTLTSDATHIDRTTIDLSTIMVKDGDETVFGVSILPDDVASTIRIVMPVDYKWNSAGTDYVYIAAGTVDDNDTPADTDDRVFFNTSNVEDGTFLLSF